MSDVRVVLNGKGIRELLKGSEMQALVNEYVGIVANNAGNGYSGNVRVGKNRAIGRVYAYTKKAINDNFKNNTLLKAIHK